MLKIEAVCNGTKNCTLSGQKAARLQWVSSGLALTLLAVMAGCGGGTSGGASETKTTTQAFDFNLGMLGWTSDVSDLPANYNPAPDGFDISYSVAPLPSPLDTSQKALRLTSFNQSDDLWQFLKRRVTGLKANTRYNVRFDVEIASDAPQDSVGIGGSPGGSVFVKAGAAAQEPKVEVQGGARVFTLDKGNQAQEGTQSLNLGTVGISGEEFDYQLKRLNNGTRLFPVRTDSEGNLWVYVGTDSGYEGRKTLFYTSVKVTFVPA
jgi:hypothetical protein